MFTFGEDCSISVPRQGGMAAAGGGNGLCSRRPLVSSNPLTRVTHQEFPCIETSDHTDGPLVHVTCTSKRGLGHDTSFMLEYCVYSVNQIVIPRIVTLCKLTYRLVYVFYEVVQAVRMIFNLPIT